MERQNEGRTKSSGMRVTQEVLEILILKGIKDSRFSQAFHLFPVPVVALGLYEYDAVVQGRSEEFKCMQFKLLRSFWIGMVQQG